MHILISIIGGLGLFLYGISVMGEGLQKSTGPKLEKAIGLLTSNIVMGVLVGTVVTGIIQSSGATTVMVVGFVNAGIMNLYQAIGVIMGANIGARQIANAHTLFNIVNVILLLPFSKFIVKLSMLIIPDKSGAEEFDNAITKYLDTRMLETPAIAYANIIRESLRMGGKAKDCFSSATSALLNKSQEDVNDSLEKEKLINAEQKEIINYLIKLSNRPLDENMRLSLDLLFHTINDIERVGDLSENIAKLAQESINSNIKFSEEAIVEIGDIVNKSLDAYSLALDAMKGNDISISNSVVKLEEAVDKLDKAYRNEHMRRLNKNLCSIDSGIIYLDLLTNIERISDHSASIAKRVIMINE